METLFKLARRILKGTFKTVTDAWNGYHGVPLRKGGKFRYTYCLLSMLCIVRWLLQSTLCRYFIWFFWFWKKGKICWWHHFVYSELECNWWRTIDFLTKAGNAGIILNPKKFQFCQKSVDFAGFRISDEDMESLPKYLDSIRNSPPQSLPQIYAVGLA